jgi:hypothetical protein
MHSHGQHGYVHQGLYVQHDQVPLNLNYSAAAAAMVAAQQNMAPDEDSSDDDLPQIPMIPTKPQFNPAQFRAPKAEVKGTMPPNMNEVFKKFTTRLLTVVKPKLPIVQREWNEWYADLIAYYEMFGTCNVPSTYEMLGSGRKLGSWLTNQRRNKKKGILSPERY